MARRQAISTRRVKTLDKYRESQERDKLPAAMMFGPKEVQFLRMYAETLDFQRAKKDAGLRIDRIRNNPWLMEEIEHIEQLARYTARGQTLANHKRLMDKFEKDYNDSLVEGDRKSAVGYSSTLARMSDSALKASGEFQKEKLDSSHNVMVVLNIGGSKDKSHNITNAPRAHHNMDFDCDA